MEDFDKRDGSGYNFDEIKTGMAMEIDFLLSSSI
jgi:hypothetical protein